MMLSAFYPQEVNCKVSIAGLWMQYSNGKFGFSVQNRCWRDLKKQYDAFCDRVGWRQGTWLPYNSLIFDTNAPEGHLPTWGRRGRLWPLLASKIKICGI